MFQAPETDSCTRQCWLKDSSTDTPATLLWQSCNCGPWNDFLALVHPDCPPYWTSNSWLSVTELGKKINIHLYWNPTGSCISLFKSLGARYFPAFIFRYLYLLCLVFPMPVAHPFKLYLWYYWVWISLIDTYQKRRRCNIRAVLWTKNEILN